MRRAQFSWLRVAAVALAAAAVATCDRVRKASGPVSHYHVNPTPPRMMPPATEPPSSATAVPGEWRMQRGRLTDRYRLTVTDGLVQGDVDAAGIGTGIAVSGTLAGEQVSLKWQAAGHSDISEDGRAAYEFKFDGRVTPAGWTGRAVLTGMQLAHGKRVPVADSFHASFQQAGAQLTDTQRKEP